MPLKQDRRQILLRFTQQERDLLLDLDHLSPGLKHRLLNCSVERECYTCYSNASELEELADAVAAKNKLCKNRKEQKQWDWIGDRIDELLATDNDLEDTTSKNLGAFKAKREPALAEGHLQEANLPITNNDSAPEAMETFNHTPQEDLGGLSPLQAYHLLTSDWQDPQSVIVLNPDLPAKKLSTVPALANTRTLLEAIERDATVQATPAGNLNRKFVLRMLESFVISKKERHSIHQYNKVINEADVLPLHTTRVLTELSGLLKRHKGQFSLTGKACSLLAEHQAGELYALLFHTHFRHFNLAFLDRMPECTDLQEAVPFALYVLSRIAAKWMQPEKLARNVFPRVVREAILQDNDSYRLVWLVESRILEPLVSFGLLEAKPIPARPPYLMPCLVRKTALYDQFLRFRWIQTLQGTLH